MTVSRLRFYLSPTEAGTHFYYLDLASALSVQERKLHRQMSIRTVHGGLLKDSNQNATIHLNTVPMTWPVRTAIRRGFKLWTKMNRQALEGMPGAIRPKYHDFKVFMNAAHQQWWAANGRIGEFPDDAGTNAILNGEWLPSKYVSEDPDVGAYVAAGLANPAGAGVDPDQFYAHIIGPHLTGPGYGAPGGDNYTSVGLLQSWLDSRPQQDPDNEPNIQTQAELAFDPLSNLFDEADVVDELLENLESINDDPPYSADQPFGGRSLTGTQDNLQLQSFAVASSANPVVPLAGFQAIMGLVQVRLTVTASGGVDLLLDVDTQGDRV